MWGREIENGTWERHRERERDIKQRYHHVGSCCVPLVLLLSCLLCGGFPWVSWRYHFYWMQVLWIHRSICRSHSFGLHVYNWLFPFSHYAMVGIFVQVGCLDLPHQVQHLPIVAVCTFPKVYPVEFCPVLIPNIHLHLGLVLFAIYA